MKKKRSRSPVIVNKIKMKALYEETAKFLIDIAKYITTAVPISTILNEISPFNGIIYIVCIGFAPRTLGLGLYCTKKKEE